MNENKEKIITNNLSDNDASIEKILETVYIDDFVFVIDYKGGFLRVNDAFSKKICVDEQQIIKMNLLDFIDGEKKIEVKSLLKQIINNEINKCIIFLKPRQQSEFPIALKVVSIKWGGLNQILLTGYDISKFFLIEEALKENEARLNRIIKSLNTVIWSATVNTFNFLYMSPAAVKIYGYQPEQFISDSSFIFKMILSEDHDKFYRHLENIRKNGGDKSEFRIIRNDGEVRWISDNANIIIDSYGEISRIDGVMIDITEQKLASEAVKRSELLYNTTINAINDVIFVVNEKLEVVLVNKIFERVMKIIGIEKNMIGEHISKLLSLFGSDPAITNEYIEIFNNGRLSSVEKKINYKSGSALVEIRKLPVFEGGKVVRIVTLIHDITELREAEEKIKAVKHELLEKYSFKDIVGKSEAMLKITGILPAISESDCNLLLEGPSGVGKNLIAKAIHNLSLRHKKPFIIVNCGAIPETLLESELFGYVKGAFTDARTDKPGKFAAAEGGIILLDEISELPLSLQVKLLHVIEEKSYEPLGSNKTLKADVRIIANTNKSIPELIKNMKFREDLFYRLKIVNIKIPALRERREDIELLVQHFIEKLNRRYSKNIQGVSNKVMAFFMAYSFPGNIRELQNMFEHAYVFCSESIIKFEHFPDEYRNAAINENSKNESSLLPAVESEISNTVTNIKDAKIQAEKKMLQEVFKTFGGNRGKMAQNLKISRVELWRKMKKHNML